MKEDVKEHREKIKRLEAITRAQDQHLDDLLDACRKTIRLCNVKGLSVGIERFNKDTYEGVVQ